MAAQGRDIKLDPAARRGLSQLRAPSSGTPLTRFAEMNVDVKAEAARLGREHAKASDEVARLEKKLSNEKFVANAPHEVVEAEREKLNEHRANQARLDQALARLRDAG
jgi:valyl-tRNA synthetase